MLRILVPDFRSSTGLFKTLKAEHNLKGTGKDLFDAAVYRDAASTSSFHSMLRSMSSLATAATPTPFHHLIARLAHEGRLLRLYSQNVDGLETSLEPLRTEVPLPVKGPWPKTIQLHGGLEKMACSKCNNLSSFEPELFEGPVPPLCVACEDLDRVRTEHAGKRSHGIGRLRPRMVLYNEANPDDEAIGAVARADMRTRPDAVIVVGTTLKVPGVRRIVREMCSIVRDRRDGLAVWINHDPVPSGKDVERCWDLIVRGTADEVAERVGLGRWDEPIEEVQPLSQEEEKRVEETEPPRVVIPSTMRKASHPILEIATFEGSEEGDCVKVEPLKDTTNTTQPRLKNPASQGRSINTVLGRRKNPIETKQGVQAKKVAGKSATGAVKPTARKVSQPKQSLQKTRTPAAQTLQAHFKLSKARVPPSSATKNPKGRPVKSAAPNASTVSPVKKTATAARGRKSRSPTPAALRKTAGAGKTLPKKKKVPDTGKGKDKDKGKASSGPMDAVSPGSKKVNATPNARNVGDEGACCSASVKIGAVGGKKGQTRLLSFPGLTGLMRKKVGEGVAAGGGSSAGVG